MRQITKRTDTVHSKIMNTLQDKTYGLTNGHVLALFFFKRIPPMLRVLPLTVVGWAPSGKLTVEHLTRNIGGGDS